MTEETAPSSLDLALDALSSGENSAHHLDVLGDLTKIELISEGFSASSVSASIDVFLPAFIDSLAAGLPPKGAFALAKEVTIEQLSIIDAAQQDNSVEDSLLKALATGEEIDPSLLEVMGEWVSSQAVFQQTIQQSLTEGTPIAKAMENSSKAVLEDEYLSAQGDSFLKALAGADGLAEAFKELEDAVTKGVPEEYREVALKAFTETLKEMLALGKSLDDAKEMASTEVQSAVEQAKALQGDMSSQDAFLTALASGNGVEKAIGDMGASGPGANAQNFQNALANALAEGLSSNDSFESAQADALAVTMAEASVAIEVPPGNDLLAALATGDNIQSIIESFTQNGTDAQVFQAALSEALASGASPANAIIQAAVQAEVVAQLDTGATDSLLAALATGENVPEGNDGSQEFQKALADALANEEDFNTAMFEAEDTARAIDIAKNATEILPPSDSPVAPEPVSVVVSADPPSVPVATTEAPTVVASIPPVITTVTLFSPPISTPQVVPAEPIAFVLPPDVSGFGPDVPEVSGDESDPEDGDEDPDEDVEPEPTPRSVRPDDDDPPTPQPNVTPSTDISFSITASSLSISEEAGAGTNFTIVMNGDALTGANQATVNINSSGSATDGTDYYIAIDDAIASEGGGVSRLGSILTFTSEFDGSLEFTVTAIDDGEVEDTETIVVTLSGATVTDGSATITTAQASTDITEVDAGISFEISASPLSISEEAGAGTNFTIVMNGDALVGANQATVNIIPSGSATDDIDYSSFYAAIDDAIANEGGGVSRLGSILTFTSEFDGSLKFIIFAIDDAAAEGTETIVATLSDAAVTNGRAGITAAEASVDITETDPVADTPHIVPPMYNYSPSSGSVSQILGSTEGIAVTFVDNTYGDWFYSNDNSTWIAFTGLSDTSATLLSGGEYIRFVADPLFDGQATFTFKVWDESTNTSQDTGVDTTSTSSVISGYNVASVSVVSENPTSNNYTYNYSYDLASDLPTEWLAINLTAGKTYTFTVENTETYDADISGIYNVGGFFIPGTTDETASGDSATITYLATSSGYHYIEITSDSDLAALIAAGDPTAFSYDFTYSEVVDPLVIDLDGNGIAFISADHDFAMTPDGTSVAEGWVNGDDGFLVLDKNGDGQIDNISEMFSEYFSDEATSGMAALIAFDENADQVLNSSDAIFSELSIWQDLNSNGLTDQGELRSLAEWGITEISLASETVNEVDSGNVILSESQVTFEDGRQTSMIEAGLVVENAVTYSQMITAASDETQAMSEDEAAYEFTQSNAELNTPLEQEISPLGDIA
ncbi:MAG: hypothetical protein JKY12_00030 [Sneathiella sp.]|nr:hypothetical protein [Sneathiella sp.]